MAKYDTNGFITELDKNEIFVFGSNGNGNHVGGAAKTAYEKFGAIRGRAEGLQGQSYAINTMDGYETIKQQVLTFIDFATKRKDLIFLVTEIGCGIARYTTKQIAPLFSNVPPNVVLPKSFKKQLNN